MPDEFADALFLGLLLSEAGLARIVGQLQAWHERRGSKDPRRQAFAQGRVLVYLVVDELPHDVIAEKVGCSTRTVGRHVRDLTGAFPPLREWIYGAAAEAASGVAG